jgi:hypothetical protein
LISGHLQTHTIICYLHSSLHPQSGIPFLCFQCHIAFLRSVRRLLVIANVVPSSPILVTLMMEALRSSKTSVLTRATRHNIPKDGIFHTPVTLKFFSLSYWVFRRADHATPLYLLKLALKFVGQYQLLSRYNSLAY